MHAVSVDPGQRELIWRILQIHDEMPRAWNPGHRTAPGYLEKMLEDIVGASDEARSNHGFWVLSPGAEANPESVRGTLWAKLYRGHDGVLACSVNSLWVAPELRGTKSSLLLTEACLSWARSRDAARIECTTHTHNARMRAILENMRFEPGMISYSLPL